MDETTATAPEIVRAHGDPLRHTTVVPVLGITVTFETNDPAVITIIEEAFGAWHAVQHAPRLISDMRVRFRIHVERGDEANDGEHVPFTVRAPDVPRLMLRSPASMGIADAARREAILYTTTGLVADRHHFRHNAIESLMLGVLTRLDRQPLNAACITRGDTALLISGPGGSGRSTIAYAAARAGYGVLAEDYISIQLEPRMRVWGTPGWIHLPVDAIPHFSELEGREPDLVVGGVPKIAISMRKMGALPAMPVAQRAGVCVLAPAHDGETSLETLDAGELQEAMIASLDPGVDLFAETIGDCIGLLASQGGWRLRTGPDPKAALDHVNAMFDVLAGA